ncbi:FimV/HubP family polar landmark protein [Nitrosomonas aestuarii]|uniref:FimV/HubP family polar landmark protein n=1 Tax=Nitrosomonas aestuarii TaxID=52441 RepID=UPI000D324EFA|nr:FimV/HubP family polar landmark protein [Nitrosomonas aestuarii]PTN12669.1 pilus assembly protein FimV [Nitrosomonas aestuarii]
MYTSFLRACLYLFGLIFTITVNAAGLGKLTINSSLGQPLNAEIDLVSVSEEELSTLKAEFASREAFAQAGIRYEPFFSTFRVLIESRVNGTPYVKITSPQSINEPFLNMLVELSWASGRLLREYTVLLDPADTQVSEPVVPVVRSVQENTGVIAGTETISAVQGASQMTPVTSPPVAQPAMEMRQLTPERAVQPPDTYGPILEGDTLSSIARQVKPKEVNVNQMLVALYRANREAFIADNMNLLRTGVVLKIPDLQALTEISEKDASAEVKVQVSNWHQYRQNLALSSQEQQGSETLKQTDSGQITTTIDSAAVTQARTPEEVLRLSSGASASDSQNVPSDLSTQERVRMMEEDAIARNLALREANERVAMLEKNVENLQKLLALQSSDLTQAQINAQTQVQRPKSEIESIEVIQSDAISSEVEFADSAIELDVMTEADSTTLPATDKAEMIETKPVAPAVPIESSSNPIQSPESEEASVLDQVMDNLIYLGAIAAILLLTLLAVVFRRRRKAAEAEAEAEESKYEELSSALRNKTAAAVAAAHVVENEKDDQDEFDQPDHFFPEENSRTSDDVTKIDLTSDSDEPVKTLEQESFDSDQAIELDFSNENEQSENEATQLLSESESSAEINEFDDNNSSGIGGLSDAPDELNDLLGSGDQSKAEVPENDIVIDDEHSIDFPDNEVNLADNDTENYELKIDFDETKESPEAHEWNEAESNKEQASKSESHADDNALDFSIDPSAIDLADDSNAIDENAHKKDSEVNMLDIPELDSSSKLQDPDVNANALANSEKEASEIDFSDINLDIENTDEISDHQEKDRENESAAAFSEPNAKNEQWHEIETKIDLARAYLEMEDKEGAREMLEEVVQEGDDNQQKTATELLEKL